MKRQQIEIVDARDYKFEYPWPRKPEKWQKIAVLRYKLEGDPLEIETASWTTAINWQKSIWNAFHNAFQLHQPLLFAALDAPVEASVIKRRRRLWKGLQTEFQSPDFFSESLDVEIETDGLVQFAGIASLSEANLPFGLELCRIKRTAAIFASQVVRGETWADESQRLYRRSFADGCTSLDWPAFIEAVLEKNGIPIRYFGPPDYGGLYIDLFYDTGAPEGEYLATIAKTLLSEY